MQIPFHHSSLKNFYELIKNDDLFKELIETNQKLNAPLLNYIYTHLLPDAVLQYRLEQVINAIEYSSFITLLMEGLTNQSQE